MIALVHIVIRSSGIDWFASAAVTERRPSKLIFVAAFPSDYNGNETNQITTARTLFHYHNSHPPHRKGVRPADQIHQLILQQATAYKDPEYCGMTEACLVDRLKQNLATITESITVTDTEKIYDNRKYYNQAHNLLKIATRRPVPHFLISRPLA